jgi:tetratricopeptide (TPR) repeat protein
MNSPDLNQIRAAVAQDPRNAELRYLLGAELAQQKDYSAAVAEMNAALELDPGLHFARFQLGLLYLTMAQPHNSLATWEPLESLDESAALKYFKRGLEALIRDDFDRCIGLLRQGINLNTQNTPLNRDMSMVIDNVRTALVQQVQNAADAPASQPQQPATASRPGENVRTDFSLYVDPNETKH